MVIGHRAQGSSGDRLLEKQCQQAHQQCGNHRGVQVFLVDQNTARKHRLQHDHRVLGHADIDGIHIATENRLPDAVQKIADAQGRHQQGRAFLVHQMAQCQAFDQPGHHKHHRPGTDEGQQIDHKLVVQPGVHRQPLGKTRHRQRRKQHHGALRKVEHARGLVDQHKAQCHQRIQHAGHQAAEQSFKEKTHIYL